MAYGTAKVPAIVIQNSANSTPAAVLMDGYLANLDEFSQSVALVPLPIGEAAQDAQLMILSKNYLSGGFGTFLGSPAFTNELSASYIDITDPSESSKSQAFLGAFQGVTNGYYSQLILAADPGANGASDFVWVRLGDSTTVWRLHVNGSIEVTGDETFADNTHGPVLVDQSDGHTYRLISTGGILSTVEVS